MAKIQSGLQLGPGYSSIAIAYKYGWTWHDTFSIWSKTQSKTQNYSQMTKIIVLWLCSHQVYMLNYNIT